MNNPEDNQLENKDWREELVERFANGSLTPETFDMDGEYLDGRTEDLIDFIQSLLSQQAEKQRECLNECISVRNEVCMPIEKYQKLIGLIGKDLTNNKK